MVIATEDFSITAKLVNASKLAQAPNPTPTPNPKPNPNPNPNPNPGKALSARALCWALLWGKTTGNTSNAVVVVASPPYLHVSPCISPRQHDQRGARQAALAQVRARASPV